MVIIILLTAILIQGVLIMSAIENLNQAVSDLQATVNALVIPVSNDVAIQSAADSINASVVALKAKVA